MNKHSFKKEIVHFLSKMTAGNDLENHYIYAVTSGGIIKGRFFNIEDIEIDKPYDNAVPAANYLINILENNLNSYKDKYNLPKDELLSDNDGYIFLEDVTVTHSNSQIHLPFIVLFYDQIAAITLGATELSNS